MLAAIATGAMYGRAEMRTSTKTGKQFVTAKIAVRDGDWTTWVNVAGFTAEAVAKLAGLNDGEYVTVQGKLKVDTFEKNGKTYPSVNITAENVVTLRQDVMADEYLPER